MFDYVELKNNKGRFTEEGLYQFNRKYIVLRDNDKFDELIGQIRECPLEDLDSL